MTMTSDPIHSTPWPVDRTIPETDWHPPVGTRIVSADDHVMEQDFWIEKLEESDRDRAPRITRDERGFHLSIGGVPADQPGFNSLMVEGRPGVVDVEQ